MIIYTAELNGCSAIIIPLGENFWRWSACREDGSGGKGDWRPTLRGAKDEASRALKSLAFGYNQSLWNKAKVRFKKEKIPDADL